MADGMSVITERIFPDRFLHVGELNRMGAKIRKEGATAVIHGVPQLFGALRWNQQLFATVRDDEYVSEEDGLAAVNRLLDAMHTYEDTKKDRKGSPSFLPPSFSLSWCLRALVVKTKKPWPYSPPRITPSSKSRATSSSRAC